MIIQMIIVPRNANCAGEDEWIIALWILISFASVIYASSLNSPLDGL